MCNLHLAQGANPAQDAVIRPSEMADNSRDRVRELALEWYSRATDIRGNRDKAHRSALAEAYEDFVNEKQLDDQIRSQLSAYLFAGAIDAWIEVAA